VGELGWKAQQFLPIGSNFAPPILKPTRLENAKGAISATPTKPVGDPEWASDPAYLEWLAFMKSTISTATSRISLTSLAGTSPC
jgi:branched-chain amino acid transport system substrate-binding protein